MPEGSSRWYEGKHQDALFYLLTAIFLLEMVIGGIAFFYGIIHASPEIPGGPPVARFPWLGWALASALGPVALILVIHLAGSWLAGSLVHDAQAESDATDKNLPEGMQRFYAAVRHAPLILILLAILAFGALLYFVDGAFASLVKFGEALLPYLPWLAVSLAALLAFCFLIHALMVFRQRKLEHEYAWRREVLEKTGLVITEKTTVALPPDETMALAETDKKALPVGEIVEVKAQEKE